MQSSIQFWALRILSFLFILNFVSHSETEEDQWKFNALFISNFARYIKWPDSSSHNTIITILGNDPVLNELKKVADLVTTGKKLIIQSETDIEKIIITDILFIPANRSDDLPRVVKQFDTKPVLIVTNRKGLILQGACINLNNLYWKLRYEINTKNLENHKLIADPILYKLGKVIN